MSSIFSTRLLWVATAAARSAGLATALLAASSAMAQTTDGAVSAPAGFSAGLSAHGRTTEADIGLPPYPGAVPQRDPGNEGAGGSLGLWGGPFGVQLHVLKLRSSDPVDTVARFYRAALGKHGDVLDCLALSKDERLAAAAPERGSTKVLSCGSDRPKPGGTLLKVGTPSRMRLVALEPMAGGTLIQLVRLETRSE